jgi:hypothetical protein
VRFFVTSFLALHYSNIHQKGACQNGLLRQGYHIGSGIPVTLIGGYFEAKKEGDVPNYQAHIVDVVTSLIEQQTKLTLPGQQANKNLE